ncbi:MAG: peptide chain release factor 2 [Myxococcota bacterium]
MEKELESLKRESERPEVWNDIKAATANKKRQAILNVTLKPFDTFRKLVDDARTLWELAVDAGAEEEEVEILALVAKAEAIASELEFKKMLGGKYDAQDAFLEVNAGAGGTESCDWANMLLRMYLRYCERKGFKASIVSLLPGEEAGIKNATVSVEGEYAYGYLKAERGVHRLVRISPFDANARRHTSFASVDVMPQLDEEIEIEINPDDLRIDTYRSQGAGGQHVNKTDSAVRITHYPTGIVVACQNERSQHQNKATALRLLKARLYELEEQKREEERKTIGGEKRAIAWGSQIRSYVLHPYRMVKDLRTGVETGKVDAVLDGELDDLIQSYLLQMGGKSVGESE